jgi:hypothetical protein
LEIVNKTLSSFFVPVLLVKIERDALKPLALRNCESLVPLKTSGRANLKTSPAAHYGGTDVRAF